jgi:hypothetical protein
VVSWGMAGKLTPAPARRRIAADSIDAALMIAITAPIGIPMYRRMWREMKAARKQQTGYDFDPHSVRPPTRAQVLKWLFKPQKPRHRDWDEWAMLVFSHAYTYGQLFLWGRTVGQRAMGLRTVRSSDGAPPNWELPTHPQRPLEHLALGITVIEDPPPARRHKAP